MKSPRQTTRPVVIIGPKPAAPTDVPSPSAAVPPGESAESAP